MVVYVGVYCINYPDLKMSLENRGGFVLDTWFVYLATRLCISNQMSLISFIKMAALIQIPLAVLGVIGAITGWQPYLVLYQYCPWKPEISLNDARWGFTRAQGPFSHSIMFGDYFVTFLPLIWTLRLQRNLWRKLAYFLSAIAILGAISCFSSGCWIMLGASLCFQYIKKWKQNVKPIAITIVIAILLIEIISNRPAYHVLSELLNTGGVWYQRAQIIDCAIEDFSKWWLAGYGGVDPGWATGGYMAFSDINNQFILTGVECGIWGVIALCSVFIVSFQELIASSKKTINKGLKSLYWALGVILSATSIAWLGVSYFGQMTSIFYLILGMIGSAVLFPTRAVVNLHRVNSKTKFSPIKKISQQHII